MKVWAGCALDPLCMCSEYNTKQFSCDLGIRKYSKCHRADQSAHVLILAKLFRSEMDSFTVRKGKYHVVRRGETANYLEDLERKMNSSKRRSAYH